MFYNGEKMNKYDKLNGNFCKEMGFLCVVANSSHALLLLLSVKATKFSTGNVLDIVNIF